MADMYVTVLNQSGQAIPGAAVNGTEVNAEGMAHLKKVGSLGTKYTLRITAPGFESHVETVQVEQWGWKIRLKPEG